MGLCLKTAAANGPIVHPPGDMWAWRAMVMMMSAGDNSWLVRQSSLSVLPRAVVAATGVIGTHHTIRKVLKKEHPEVTIEECYQE
jgi:hypothetical protein